MKKERREGEVLRRDLFFITSTINGKTNIKNKVYDLNEPLAHNFVIYIEKDRGKGQKIKKYQFVILNQTSNTISRPIC